jgi:hypothetical protein
VFIDGRQRQREERPGGLGPHRGNIEKVDGERAVTDETRIESAGKCAPSTIVSTAKTSATPGGAAMSAPSSPTPASTSSATRRAA